MSDEQKTEQPTTKKKEDARQEGQVAQSKDITMASAVMVILLYVACMSKTIALELTQNFSASFNAIASLNKSGSYVISMALTHLGIVFIYLVVIPVVLASVVSLAVNTLQLGGIVLAVESYKIDLDKFNPVTNFKNMFSAKTLLKFVKDVFEITIMVIVAYSMVSAWISNILMLQNLTLPVILKLLCFLISKLFIVLLPIYFVFGIIDFIIEKINLHKQLMMSLQEIKQEHKDSEGDNEIKQKRKELHREILEDGGSSSNLANSTLVLANPTHIAIVILYSPKRWKAPVILAKARGDNAQKIFKLARQHKVPIIRDKWLARSLFEYGEIGKFVPMRFVRNVADIIGKNIKLFPQVVLELKTKMAQGDGAQKL